MKILILGKGYVGSNLHKVINSKSDMDCEIVSRSQLNYTSVAELRSHMTINKINVCINTCGYTGSPNVDACEQHKDEAWYYNVIVPMNIMIACRQTGVKLVNISSGCIYTGYDKKFTEDDEPNFGLFNSDSSWYSKTKHACEMNFKRSDVYNIRIRLPFCDKMVPKNALVKLLKYEKIIDKLNSITSIPDLGKFIVKFIEKIKSIKPGVYNVVNPYPVTTKEMKIKMLEIFAPGKTPVIIPEEELYKKTAARRSNCVLSDDKIAKLGLRLPDTTDSLDYCIDKLRNEIKPT